MRDPAIRIAAAPNPKGKFMLKTDDLSSSPDPAELSETDIEQVSGGSIWTTLAIIVMTSGSIILPGVHYAGGRNGE